MAVFRRQLSYQILDIFWIYVHYSSQLFEGCPEFFSEKFADKKPLLEIQLVRGAAAEFAEAYFCSFFPEVGVA